MKKTPAGWPRISASLYYQRPQVAIEWLCKTFGFEVRLKIDGENGRIEHSELTFGDDGMVMVGTAGGEPSKPWQASYSSPASIGQKNTQGLAVYVDDVDAHYAKAKAGGATIFLEPRTQDHGEEYWSDRSYGALDTEGHQWFFMQRMRDASTSRK